MSSLIIYFSKQWGYVNTILGVVYKEETTLDKECCKLPRRDDVNRPKSDDFSSGPHPATISHCLKAKLKESIIKSERGRQSTLISSNKLANRFILERWGIRPSQRRRYKNLFSRIRKQARLILRQYLDSGFLELRNNSDQHKFSIYQFDDIRGNLIIGFYKSELTPSADGM